MLYRAVLLCFVWWFFPPVVFVAAALVLYVFKSFRKNKPWWTYLIIIGLLASPGMSVWPRWFEVVILGVSIYLFFGIRELIFVNRLEAVKILTILTVILAVSEINSFVLNWSGGWLVIGPLLFGLGLMLFMKDLWAMVKPDSPECSGLGSSRGTGTFLFGVLLALVLAEMTSLSALLPLPFLYRSILVVLPVFLGLDLFLPKYGGNLSRKGVWMSVSLVVVVLVVTLFSAPFGLRWVGFYR